MSLLAEARTPAPLLPLREEIAIFPGPTALDGSPTWTLHDPANNRFYRLGWQEFEIISRWDMADAETLADRVNDESTLAVDAADVEELGRFLAAYDLLRASGPQATARLLAKAERMRESWAKWLLHNYLFMRIPLVRPDRFLSATYPYVRWIHSRAFALAILAIGFAGLYLIARQWDVFLATFVDMFSVTGAVAFGLTLAALKTIHELGHAYTAKRFGCRVPTMGVALLVLVPVLYTDVNESWKLTSRRQRLAIGVAGVTAELCCAAIAAFAWGFLPPGPARSVAFLVATSTWVTTVLLNASPFMRYDGYYVLSDTLEMPNLHQRAFALARWWLREKLLGLGDEAPEEQPPRRQLFLVAFAFLTWLYRFTLFLGIAVIVYHFAVKILGIAMMVVEVGFFVVWPVLHEAYVWWGRRKDMRMNTRTLITATAAIAIVAALVVPWRSTVEAPALLKSQEHVDVFVPEFGARLLDISVRHGEAVQAGAVLARLESPDIDYRLGQARTQLDTLEWQMGAKGMNADILARSQVTEREYQEVRAEFAGLNEQKSRLQVTSPIAGSVVDLADGLEPGSWLAPKSRLLSIVDPAGVIVDAYVDEADLERIAPGAKARFVGEADSMIEYPLKVVEVARASTRVLTDPPLASTHGGPVEVRPAQPAPGQASQGQARQEQLVPDHTIYRVRLAPAGPMPPLGRILRGHVLMQGEATSLAARAWRAFLAVVIRESGA
jgi:putative peptide zinc metalloprotease protein